MTRTAHRHSPAFDDALMNAGHALKTPDPIQALVPVLMAFRDEYRAEVLAELSQTATSPVLPSSEDTAAGDESPHVYLTAIRHQAGHAHDFTKAGRMAEALEHVEAIERLLAVYRRAVGAEKPADRRVAELERVLARAASPEPCRWEGRVCVTHSWGSDVGLCPHGEAQQLLGGAA